LIWVGLIALPFSLLAGIVPGAIVISLGAITLLLLIVLVDAVLSRNALSGITVEAPPIARMSKDREARLEVRIRNERLKPFTLSLSLVLPPELQSHTEETLIALPAGVEWSRFDWICTPLSRGKFQAGWAYFEAPSPFAFWAVRKTVPLACQIRVYPNLMTERKDLAALFLHRGSLGLHVQRQVGKGRDFEKLREYIPGDSFDEVHWKATAKRGHPITKIFQVERTQEVYVIIDSSRLSARKTEGRASSPGRAGSARDITPAGQIRQPPLDAGGSTIERFITAALVLGLAAEQQGDLFGLVTFSNRVENFIRAKNGKAHYDSCRDALYILEPQLVTPDFDELCTLLRLRLRRRALLVFLTSLDDSVLAEAFIRNIELIRRQHLVLVNMLQPPGVAPLFTNPNINSLDELYQDLGGHLLWHKLRELEKVLQRRGVRFSLLKNERLSAELVSQYLNVKQRQLI